MADPPAPPHEPLSPAAQNVSNRDVKNAVDDIEDRVKRAEWWMIRLTAAIALFALGSVIVGVLQWNAMRGQLREMQSSSGQTDQLIAKTGTLADNAGKQADRTKDLADRMKEQAERTKDLVDQSRVSANAAKESADVATSGIRPWIKITDVQTRGEGPEIPALSFQQPPTWPYNQSQATFQLKISLKNVGHSPAKMTVGFELLLPLWKDGYGAVIYTEKKRFCAGFSKQGTTKEPTLQRMLFPEESYDWYGGGAAIVNSNAVNDFGGNKYILLAVAVCANYQFGDSPAVYQTSALYEVFRKDDRSRFFEVNRGVPASGVFLIRNEASDDAY